MPQGYHHLDQNQRCQLYTLKERGDSLAVIAQVLGVHRSSLYREVQRNTGQRGYPYEQAEEKAQEHQGAIRQGKKKMLPSATEIIKEKLRLQWSPIQISGWLQKVDPKKTVSHETIYRYVWENKQNGGSLYKELRHYGKKYNKRSQGSAGRGSIPNRIGIKERPPIVKEKTRLGDWELDTIIGTDNSGVIVSMVERTSKLTMLAKIPRRTAEETEAALVKRLFPIRDFVHTLTADNSKEFANHQRIGCALEASVYFATPYHSWEKGLNEHTNGLVRQYFPKSYRFDQVSADALKKVEALLNNRPRKILNFATPMEVSYQLSKNLVASHLLESSA